MAPRTRAGAGQWSGPQFETLVLKAFKTALLEYVNRAEPDPRVPRRLPVRITVVTTTYQRETLYQQIQAFAERTLYRDLPGTRLESLAFPLDRTVGEPGYRIRIDPVLPGYTTDPGGLRHPPLRPVSPVSPVEESPATLILIYGEMLRFQYPLFFSDSWLSLGRGLPDNDWPALRIPDYVTAIPRGALLKLRYQTVPCGAAATQEGDGHLRRTRDRWWDCVIEVDRLRLDYGDVLPTPLEADGTIEYVLNSAPRSILTYQLERRE